MSFNFQLPEPDANGRIQVIIRNADDAWSLFQATLESVEFPDNVDIKFEGWPKFQLTIEGRDWDSTIPTRIMTPLLEVQKDIHRAYAIIHYGSDNLRKLKDEEREALELVVKLEKGSSKFEAPLEDKLTDLAKKAVGKMNGREIAITVLGLALIYGGVEVSKAWIATRQAEVQGTVTVQLSKEETQRMDKFIEGIKQVGELAQFKEDREDSQNRVLKSLKPTDSIKLSGVSLNGADAAEITQQERARSVDVELAGKFRVLANDASKPSGFRIKVQRIVDNLTITADVPIELPDDQKKLLQAAEWSNGKTLVELRINATDLRGKFSNATLFFAGPVAISDEPKGQ